MDSEYIERIANEKQVKEGERKKRSRANIHTRTHM